MNVGLGDESDSTICRMKRVDNLPCFSVHFDHKTIGRSKVGNGLKVSHPVVKLAGDGIGDDGVEELDGDHHQTDQSDQEPPGQRMRSNYLQEMWLARYPGTGNANIVVAVVI